MTDRGFNQLIKTFNKFGYELEPDPDHRVNFSMLSTAGEILKKDLNENKFDKLFQKKTSPDEQKTLDGINYYMSLVVPFINDGKKPDIASLAREAGIDIKTAREITAHLIERLGKL
jgi:hypothetical protein